jgi:carbon storage regulator CsrA
LQLAGDCADSSVGRDEGVPQEDQVCSEDPWFSRLTEKEFDMLTLRRKPGESVIITVGDVRIRVIYVRNHSYQGKESDLGVLAFEAPLHVQIHREEVQDRIDRGERSNPAE